MYGPRHSFSVLLPADWKFRDASYPSDHSTYYWYDPHDAFAKLEIVGSACVGCVSKNSDGVTPTPSGELPQHTTVTAHSDPYVESFNRFDTPYSDNGMVIVTHPANSSGINGSIIVQLWLPLKEQTESAQILASFRASG